MTTQKKQDTLFVIVQNDSFTYLGESQPDLIENNADNVYTLNTAKEIVNVYDSEDIAKEQKEYLEDLYPQYKFSIFEYHLVAAKAEWN